MKAIQVTNYGGTDEIHVAEDVAKPELKAGQVLVEVHAASLNRIDSKIREGYMKDFLPLAMPFTQSGDFAGVVSEVADDVTTLKVGDEVYGNAGQFKGGSGSLADFVVANATSTTIKPSSLDFTQAAAVPLVGATAMQGIETEVNVQSGQKILIQGGAGGVGAVAVQIAKMHGAYVATTVGTDDVELAKMLGADEVIDYKTQDVTQLLKEYDAVFDTAGGDNADKLFAVLKKGGVFVTVAGQPNQDTAKEHEITAKSEMAAVSVEQLQKLAELVDGGKLKIGVEKTFPFDQAKEAFEFFETQHPKGKIVVTLK